MRNPFRVIWNYLSPSWEDDHGHFSYKRASAYVILGLIATMVLKNAISSTWTFYTFLTLAVLFAVIVGIITIPQLLMFLSAKTGFKLPSNLLNYNNDEKDTTAAAPDGDSSDAKPGV